MESVAEVLSDLHALFQRRGIDWYVFGAQAVVVYGRPRQTLDIDVTADIAPKDVSVFIDALLETGYSTRFEDLVEFAHRTRAIPVLHEATGIPVDTSFSQDPDWSVNSSSARLHSKSKIRPSPS